MLKALATLAAVAALATPAGAEGAKPFTFALNWFPVGDHAAYWVALDRGYFDACNLDVELQNSKGSADSIAKVDSGRADAGIADSATVAASTARGTTVRVVGMIFDKTPMNFFSLADNAVTEPRQLEGRSVGAPPGDSERQMWPAFAEANGIDQSKVTWVNIEPAAKAAALAERRVDVIADYTTGLPIYEKPIGEGKVAMMPWSEHGFDMYAGAIFASDKTMRERPQDLQCFLKAAYQGWQDTMKDPDAAMAIFKQHVPEIDEAVLHANLMLGLDLMRTERYAEHGIGWIEEAKMCHTVDLVNTYMDLPKKVACGDVYTTEFLPKIAMPAPDGAAGDSQAE